MFIPSTAAVTIPPAYPAPSPQGYKFLVFIDCKVSSVYFQEKYEKLAYELGGKNYNAPVQLVGDFLNDAVLRFDVCSINL